MAASDTLIYTVTSGVVAATGAPTESPDLAAAAGVFTAPTAFVGSGDSVENGDVVVGPPGFYQGPEGEGTWVQLLNDVASRFDIPYLQPPSESWQVNSDAPWVTGRRYQLGLSGEHVSNEWTFETVWPVAQRPQADNFVALLKAAAESADARLLINISAPVGGTAIQFVGETHQINQQYSSGSSTVSVTFTRVDAT